MDWSEAFSELGRVVLSRAELIAMGATGRSLTAAVRAGHLIRAMRDHYVLPAAPTQTVRGVRVGGLLTCISALKTYGVFAYDTSLIHLHLPHTASRLRSPHHRGQPLAPRNRTGLVLHWWPLAHADEVDSHRVGLVDALIHAVRCQPRELAVAAVDSALHQGMLTQFELEEIFVEVPERYRALRADIEGLSESGQETVLRLLMKDAGLSVRVQQQLDGVGRVDMVVEDTVVLEADSKLAHEGWERELADRWRVIQAAKLGYMSLRPAFQHTMEHPDDVLAAVVALLRLRTG